MINIDTTNMCSHLQKKLFALQPKRCLFFVQKKESHITMRFPVVSDFL